MSVKRLFVGALVVVAAAVFAALAARHWLARQMFFSGTWLVEDANVISPEIAGRFLWWLDDAPREVAGVYEYDEGWLFSETYLRFVIPDSNEYEVFKTRITHDNVQPSTLPDRKLPPTAKHVRQWWTPPGGAAYNAGLVYFAFDDPNQTVYGLACRD
ncbi:MAG: hypothetical protein JW993_13400 [Sedimentisphaerales bacterium]|nr:hypothetical protein [Sedimentisphaerales bacterium]